MYHSYYTNMYICFMRPRFNINGELWYDMLDHVLLVSYDYSYHDKAWVALARDYRKDRDAGFIEYKANDDNVFQIVRRLDGREPLILKQYKRKYGIAKERPHATPKPPKHAEFTWRPGMTAAEWEYLNGPVSAREIAEAKIEEVKWEDT